MIGSICSQFHWRVDYLLWKVNWITVQMMLADMPWYDYEKNGSDKTVSNETFLSDLDSDGLKDFIRKING